MIMMPHHSNRTLSKTPRGQTETPKRLNMDGQIKIASGGAGSSEGRERRKQKRRHPTLGKILNCL